MKKILIPVDFSEHSDIACRYGVELAKLFETDITLFHSFFDQIYFADGGFNTGFESGVMLTDEIIFDFYRQKEIKLEEIRDKLTEELYKNNFAHLKVEFVIESGDPEVQILNAIENIKPMLVVMGSSGMGKKHFLSGSVSRRIMDHAQCPILTVPADISFEGIRKIIYMSEYSEADVRTVQRLLAIFKGTPVEIYFLHIDVSEKDKEEEQVIAEQEIRDEIAQLSPDISFHLLKSDNAQLSLKDFCQHHKADLIAFIPHHRSFFQNLSRQDLSKKDLFLTHIPILAIP